MKRLSLIHPTKMGRQKEIGEPYLKWLDAGLLKIACLKLVDLHCDDNCSNQKQMFQQPFETNLILYGDFYKPRKARFIPTFCKRINRTSTAVGSWLTAFEERRRTTFSATKFIYNNNNNNKQGFTPNGTNNEYVKVQKRVQGSDRW